MEQQQRGLCSFTPGRSPCCGSGSSTSSPNMRLTITSTTGSPVELTVPRGETVEGLRTHISNKLRMQTDRIVLLHKDSQLTAGKLLDLGVTDGSKLTLVPVVEAGIACSTAKAERGIMDVLESLTEAQISDFLSGRSPLNLNLGVGAHVMYVQLQLSAQNVAELQQHQQLHQDLRVGSRRDLQTGLPAAARMSRLDSSSSCCSTNCSTNTAGSSTPPASDSKSTIHLNSERSRTSFHSTASPSCSSLPLTNCHQGAFPHQSFPPQTPRTSSTQFLHPRSPLQAATPVCSPAPTGSDPGPPSPAPASTFNEGNTQDHATPELCKQPGAVIESFVSHSPGVFSGTFSGTLAPCSQSSISQPQGGIAIILQILKDLLRAALHHQGASPASPNLHCAASTPPASPVLTTEEQSIDKSKTLETQREGHLAKTPDEESPPLHSPTQENQALHCKLQRLQFLMQQRQTRRRTRRNSYLSQASHPY
ncbi:midnolin [Labrus bergylta]|uniref:Midnolin-like n=1 Tax=Labrus bergylta TaxID=56723 RepID=A0A3Q3DZQ1_9LABR|nr:midnolin-like [Labrus bergylta]